MVGTGWDEVDGDLVGGRLVCPGCGGRLGPWGHARERLLRLGGEECRWRPRRALCRQGCRKTHVVLVDVALLRRRDGVETIGKAIEAKAAGAGHRRIARALDRHEDTVRGWLRAFGRSAERIRAHFTRWAAALDPLWGPVEPAGDPFRDALSAMGVAIRAAVLTFGPRSPWRLASWMTGGTLLGNTSGTLLCNTSYPLHAMG
jgi:hypothetical protein